ncbi:transposase [Streptomyces avermitilis]
MVDHGGAIRRHELTDLEWELLAPLIPRAAAGRPRVEDRQVVNGLVHKIRTRISWRDLPERYGPWKTVYTRFRRYAIDGSHTRVASTLGDFLRHSPAVHALTSGSPHAVVVYDPTDTYFSTDPKNLFVDAYREYGDIDEVAYSERPGATTSESVANDVSTGARRHMSLWSVWAVRECFPAS